MLATPRVDDLRMHRRTSCASATAALRLRYAAAASVVSLFCSIASATPASGCEKDTDCKGDRICEAGKCVSPATPAATSAGQGAPAQPTPAAPPQTPPSQPRPAGPKAVEVTVEFKNTAADCQADLQWRGASYRIEPLGRLRLVAPPGQHTLEAVLPGRKESTSRTIFLGQEARTIEVTCVDRNATLTLLGFQAGLHMPYDNQDENPPSAFSAVHSGAFGAKLGSLELGPAVMWDLRFGNGGTGLLLGGGVAGAGPRYAAEVGIVTHVDGPLTYFLTRWHLRIGDNLALTISSANSFSESMEVGNHLLVYGVVSIGVGLTWLRV